MQSSVPCWALRCMALTGEILEVSQLLTHRWAAQQQVTSACFPSAGLPRQKAARPHATHGPPLKLDMQHDAFPALADSKGHLHDGTPGTCKGCRSLSGAAVSETGTSDHSGLARPCKHRRPRCRSFSKSPSSNSQGCFLRCLTKLMPRQVGEVGSNCGEIFCGAFAVRAQPTTLFMVFLTPCLHSLEPN